MEEKIIRFHIFRYHLLPLESHASQGDLFQERVSPDDARKNKNIYFRSVIDNLITNNPTKFPLQLQDKENDYFLFKLAQKKSETIIQNFKNIEIPNEPFVYVIINNDPKVQKIAISENIDAFTSTTVVRNHLRKFFQTQLKEYNLNIEIEQLFDSNNFWNFVNSHQDEITYINFQFIKPNLADISKSLPKVFKNFSDNVNSHESHITIKAPSNGKLENINKKNEDINGLVNYTSEGAGEIKVKVKGLRKQLNTKDSPVIIEIKDILLEGPADQVIKVYQTIVND
ncbi:MAG: hypothetical protein KL787_08890 [Taibaiella sp.]|nr:hypothetical protein [Taibaiella sp.]